MPLVWLFLLISIAGWWSFGYVFLIVAVLFAAGMLDGYFKERDKRNIQTYKR